MLVTRARQKFATKVAATNLSQTYPTDYRRTDSHARLVVQFSETVSIAAAFPAALRADVVRRPLGQSAGHTTQLYVQPSCHLVNRNGNIGIASEWAASSSYFGQLWRCALLGICFIAGPVDCGIYSNIKIDENNHHETSLV